MCPSLLATDEGGKRVTLALAYTPPGGYSNVPTLDQAVADLRPPGGSSVRSERRPDARLARLIVDAEQGRTILPLTRRTGPA